jgi:predicted ATP-grasp superfamily ATP-dependent carboligase
MVTNMKDIFLQVGSTRDGTNPYCAIAKKYGYFSVLIEKEELINYQSKNYSIEFNEVITILTPEKPEAIIEAYRARGYNDNPKVILAGFEAYNSSAFILKNLLNSVGDNPFVPLDKYEQRKIISGKINQPWFYSFSSLKELSEKNIAHDYPFIIKPIDGGGGLGVHLVKNHHERNCVIDELDNTKNYGGRDFSGFLVEEYIDGTEFSIQGVVEKGTVKVLTCCQKVITKEITGSVCGFHESGHVAFTEGNYFDLFDSFAQRCCDVFSYNNGAFHIDLIIKDDELYFIEMGFRISGMGVTSLVKIITGNDWAEEAFLLAASDKRNESTISKKVSFVSGRLRLQTEAQVAYAYQWSKKNSRGDLVMSNFIKDEESKMDKVLKSDLRRHANTLATFTLDGEKKDDIIQVFKKILHLDSDLSLSGLNHV